MADRRPGPRWLTLIAALAVAGCGGGGVSPSPRVSPDGTPPRSPSGTGSPAADAASPSVPGSVGRVILMTHSSFAISDELLAAFEVEHGARLEVLRAGDAGAMVNQAILTAEAPLADVLFGLDNTFLTRALEADLFVPYEPAGGESLPPELRLDAEWRVTPIDYGDVCLNYDRAAFDDEETPPPASLEDLADPAYRDMLVVQNPATSSPGLAFLLATLVHFGEAGDYTWLDYWADLRANGVVVTAGWEDAYYGRFSGGSGEGDRPIVVSYATSPVAEVVFADPQPEEAPTGVVEEGCFRQIEFAGVLRRPSGPSPLAEAVVDFMLDRRFQEDIPLNMFVFPASEDAAIPEAFTEHAARIEAPLTLDPAVIDDGRERWIGEWTDVVLR